jgi:glyoxylase-like metal-dependent hydrolase (beta-lactamase superfamily II)
MTEIPFVRDVEFSYGRVDDLSPLVRRVVAHNPSKFTYLGTGTYLIGRGDVAVIDAGPAQLEHVDAILASLAPGERITALLVTHTHTDHSPATAMLKARVDAPTYGFGPHGPVAIDDPTDVVVFGVAEADATTRGDPKDDSLREGADIDFRPDNVVRDGDVVSGDGWTLEAVHTPGHTSNHLCYALREEQTLFTGDHVMGWSTSVIGPPDGNMADYLTSLRLLLERDDAMYVPTHGPPVTEPHALVRAFIAHREERTGQILDELAAGPSTIARIVPSLYRDVSKTLWRPAAASIYAHLLQLVGDGRVVVEGEPRRTSTYALAGH